MLVRHHSRAQGLICKEFIIAGVVKNCWISACLHIFRTVGCAACRFDFDTTILCVLPSMLISTTPNAAAVHMYYLHTCLYMPEDHAAYLQIDRWLTRP